MSVGHMQVFLEQQGWSLWLREPTSGTGGSMPRSIAFGPEAVPSRRAVSVRMTFANANVPTAVASQQLAGTSNFFLGNATERHRTQVAAFGEVLYTQMYDGIDVRVREAAGSMEYDLLLAPGADLAKVRVQVEGSTSLSIDPSGALILETALGAVRQPAPTSWMIHSGGQQVPVLCRYELHGDHHFGFRAPDRDPQLALVVDPPLLYGSYFGGSAYDEVNSVTENTSGHILVSGYTESLNFPTTPGTIQNSIGGGPGDGFVFSIDPSQPPASQLQFATYLGGNAWDYIFETAVLPGGQIAFAGGSESPNLPTTAGAYQTVKSGFGDGIVGILDSTGTALLGLTYLGGPNFDWAVSIDVGPGGDLYLGGQALVGGFPVTANAFQVAHGGGVNRRDGFVAVIDQLVSTLTYATHVGGSGDEFLQKVVVDGNGVVTMLTSTNSGNFPTTLNALDRTANGGGATWYGSDTAIAQIDPSRAPAQQLVYGTYLGGSGADLPGTVTLSAAGEIVVCGTTTSPNFPTTANAFQSTFRGGAYDVNFFIAGDGFLAKINPALSGAAGLIAATYCGGGGMDQGLACSCDLAGEMTLVGWSNANSMVPTTPDAMRRVYAGEDGYLARFSSDASQLLYGSLLGGTNYDGAWRVHAHDDGTSTIVGITISNDLPVQNAVQPARGGGDDILIQRVQTIPTGTLRRGAPSLGSNGQPTIHAMGDAAANNAQFGIACSRAPISKLGAILFGQQPVAGVPLFGINLYVDQASLIATPFVQSDIRGEVVWPLPLPSFAFGTLHAQFVWLEVASTITLSASDALQIH